MTTRMDTETVEELRDELEEVRAAWREWTDRWEEFQASLRCAGYNTYRLDAYQVGTGSDEGGGQSIEGWLGEIETDLTAQSISSTCAGADGRCDIHGAPWIPGERHCERAEI
jgi:hypothetical protein